MEETEFERAVRGIFYKGTDPIPEGSTLMTQSVPKGFTFTITLWVRISLSEFWGDTNAQSITP